jgi:hypothetical protein
MSNLQKNQLLDCERLDGVGYRLLEIGMGVSYWELVW